MYATEVRAGGWADRIRAALRHSVLSVRGGIAQPSRGASLRLLYCHYVFDDQRREFEKIIRHFLTIGRFVTTAEVLEIVEGRKPLTSRLFHLSFDDGLKNIIINALPILMKYQVPAAFFVPTATIGASTGMASWADLEKAAARGVDIGSHTRTHARFSDISSSKAAMDDEICGSKLDLERNLGKCDYISWPYGRLSDVDEASIAVVNRAGYRGCFSAHRGRVIAGLTDRLRIPRHHFEVEWPLSHVKYYVYGVMATND